MKQFYTLALAATVALSAAAVRPISNLDGVRLPKKASISVENVVAKPAPIKAKGTKLAPAKAATVAQVQELDTWSFYELRYENQYTSSVEITVTNLVTGACTITLMEDFVLTGTFNKNTGVISIPNKQLLFEDEDGPVYFYIMGETDGYYTGVADQAATEGTYDNGVVMFSDADIWACGDPDNEALGWYFVTALNDFSVATQEEPGDEDYDYSISLGQGTIVENIWSEFFGTQTNFNPINTTPVNVEVKTDGEGHYLVENAFQALFAWGGVDAESPGIKIYADDPTNCLVPMQSCGLGDGQGGAWIYLSMSYYDALIGGNYTTDELKITLTREGDDVTITFPEECTLNTSTTILQSSGDLYYGSVAPTVIKFKEAANSVSNITLDNDANAPVVYYNLNGARVDNPNGLVIRVQGSKATKTVVK